MMTDEIINTQGVKNRCSNVHHHVKMIAPNCPGIQLGDRWLLIKKLKKSEEHAEFLG